MDAKTGCLFFQKWLDNNMMSIVGTKEWVFLHEVEKKFRVLFSRAEVKLKQTSWSIALDIKLYYNFINIMWQYLAGDVLDKCVPL